MEKKKESLRDKLIQAGITELNEHGVADFSVRRIATLCGVSCAAPYRHFAGKQEFIVAIMEYISEQWCMRQRQVVAATQGTTRQKLVAVSMEYVRFLLENPQFRSILMLKNENFDKQFVTPRGGLTEPTYDLISQYCEEVHMPRETRVRKTFSVRSLIYGAALMLDNGELAKTEENWNMVALAIDREFDLP